MLNKILFAVLFCMCACTNNKTHQDSLKTAKPHTNAFLALNYSSLFEQSYTITHYDEARKQSIKVSSSPLDKSNRVFIKNNVFEHYALSRAFIYKNGDYEKITSMAESSIYFEELKNGIITFSNQNSDRLLAPMQFFLHFQESKFLSIPRLHIQAKNLLLFEHNLPKAVKTVLDDTTNLDACYLFSTETNELAKTDVTSLDYQQESKWDNYLFITTKGFSTAKKNFVKFADSTLIQCTQDSLLSN